MKLLSVYPGHNAAVCILDDGEVVLNLELERHNRVRHSGGFDEAFVAHCLARAGLSIDDIDRVCINRGSGGELRAHGVPDTASVLSRSGLEFELLGRRVSATVVNHHVAHLASAFYTSPFEDAAVFSLDGGGDDANTGLAVGRGDKLDVAELQVTAPPVARWWAYLCRNNYRMAEATPWEIGNGAGKLMALAAYGRRDDAVLRQLRTDMRVYNRKSTNRADKSNYVFNRAEDLSDVTGRRAQDVAWSLQHFTEDIVTDALFDMLARTELPDLCYAGGVALNCIATAHAMTDLPFRRVHVPPCPNDCGLALGMALYTWHQVMKRPRRPTLFSPYTGPIYAAREIDRALEAARAAGFMFDVTPIDARGLAETLAAGHIVCHWRGRSECGPRALGHRSILCRPDLPGIRERMNVIKDREWYRPFAPIIRAERAADVLETVLDHSAYMTTSAVVRAPWRERLAGICHVDHTTRPQVLGRDMEPFLHEMLTIYEDLCGLPAVLNTSFNLKEPIVETPAEAVATFRRMDIDRLVLDDRLIVKRPAD